MPAGQLSKLSCFLLCSKFNIWLFNGKPISWQKVEVLTSLGKMHQPKYGMPQRTWGPSYRGKFGWPPLVKSNLSLSVAHKSRMAREIITSRWFCRANRSLCKYILLLHLPSVEQRLSRRVIGGEREVKVNSVNITCRLSIAKFQAIQARPNLQPKNGTSGRWHRAAARCQSECRRCPACRPYCNSPYEG